MEAMPESSKARIIIKEGNLVKKVRKKNMVDVKSNDDCARCYVYVKFFKIGPNPQYCPVRS